jgi:hypothetical protein
MSSLKDIHALLDAAVRAGEAAREFREGIGR